jgi:hypothetical protein
MNCPRSERIQDDLDGLLTPRESLELRSHLDSCEVCAADRARFERVIAAIEDAPLFDPGALFTERVLDHVVPARRRARWVRAFGWGYAAAAAACLAAGVLAFTHPASRATIGLAWDALSRAGVQAVVLALNGIGFVTLQMAQTLSVLQGALDRFAPFARALQSLLAMPSITITLCVAIVSCGALLWWMRPRSRRSGSEVPRVGLLAF